MGPVIGKYYILSPSDEYLDGPCDSYDGALKVKTFYYQKNAKIKQWTENGWKEGKERGCSDGS